MLYRLTQGVQDKISPNHASGRGSDAVRAIVIHKAEGGYEGTINWFLDQSSQVSAHYVIGLDGSITNMVDPDDTAWHAGVVADPTAELYLDKTNPNSYTVGIELAGYAKDGTPSKQIAALADLLVDLCIAYHLDPDFDTITFHRHWDKQKLCPGPWLSRKALITLVREQMFTVLAGKLPLPQ